MGRIAGVTSADTRDRLLGAAAASFETRGYDGTRVSDIADAAGVSNGAMYGHFGSKAELLAEALRDHGSQELAAVFLDDPERPVRDVLVALGKQLTDRSSPRGALVVEALVAARRDDDVADMMTGHFSERADWLVSLVRRGQADGTLDPTLSPDVVSRYCLMMALGSLLLPEAGLEPLDASEWSTLVERLGSALGPPTDDDSPNDNDTPTTRTTC